MGLAGIELRYLVDSISEKIAGYYVSNIYGITRDSILFKLHHPDQPDIFLMLTTFGMWVTEVKIDQIELHRMTRRLRDDLLRLKITGIRQVGTERIAYLSFGGFEREFVVVAEFFGDGNIILCSKEMKILALQHSLEVRHRTLRVGSTYAPPPQNGLNVFELSQGQIDEIQNSDLGCGKWVGRSLGLPARYIKEVFGRARIDSTLPGRELAARQREAIFDAVRGIVGEVGSGRHDPVIIRGARPEACPIRVAVPDELEPVPSFDRGLDLIFTEKILQEARSAKTATESGKIAQLESRLNEQNGAIRLVQERSDAISGVARLLFALVSQGTFSIREPRAEAELKRLDAQLASERGSTIIKILDEKIRIDPSSSLPAIASTLFDEAKKQSAAVPTIEKQKRKTEREIARLKSQAQDVQESVGYANIRKKNWFERYRWFFTSDGNLAVGGRDASSNSSIVRKHIGSGDRVFHAEVFGSPFFVLKDGQSASPVSINEVAHATVCFSRAWREAMYGANSYWVEPDQVKKAAPSGQFLPRGSFSIGGQRNFVRVPTLKLGVGMLERNGEYLLECGPADAVRENSLWHAVIEPGGSEPADIAKRLRSEFIKINEDAAARFSVDDFLRVLPAGKSHITKVNRRE